MSKLLEGAFSLAARGWYVFPLRGKLPATEHAHHDASREPIQLRRWWADNPTASVAISCGASGLLVLDVDPRNGGDVALRALERELEELPDTLAVSTGGGGLHLYYHLPELADERRWRGKFPKPYGGVDIKINGYVKAPPSEGYDWANSDPIAELPAAWIEACSRPRQTDAVDGEASPYRSLYPLSPAMLKAIEANLDDIYERHKANPAPKLFDACCLLARDWDLGWDEARPLLDAYNARLINPADAEHIAKRWQNALDHGSGAVGSRRHDFAIAEKFAGPFDETSPAPEIPLPPTDAVELWDWLLYLAYACHWPAQVAKAKADLEAHRRNNAATDDETPPDVFISATELLAKNFPPTAWSVTGLIPENGVGILAGEPKSTKTWNLAELALAVATGTRAFGEFDVRQGAALLVALEDPERGTRNRIRALASIRPDADLSQLHIATRPVIDLTSDDSVAWIIACARKRSATFVGIDPLRDAHSVNEDSSTDMAPVFANLRAIRDLVGCSVAILHHTSKPTADTNKRRAGYTWRGSSAIFGWVDWGFTIGKCDEDTNEWEAVISTVARSAQSAGSFALTLNVDDNEFGEAIAARWTYSKQTSVVDNPKQKERDLERVIAALVELGGAGLATEIRRVARISRQTLKACLAELEATGQGSIVPRKGFELDAEILKARRALKGS